MVDLSQGAIAAIATCATIIATLALCCLPRSAPFFSLRNRVVVVTGGSSGIGKAVALEAARRGAHVVLLARSVQPLVDAVAEIRSVSEASQRILQYSVDVTNEEKTREALKQAAADCGGRVDALVCSAGTSSPREFTSTSSAEFESVVRLNLFGTRNAIAAALPLMNGAEGGRVVLISSQAGQVGLYGYTAYSASKFALNGLAQSLSMELAPQRILVSVSYPPDTDTPLLTQENLQKPRITRLLSEATATVAPDVVARGIVEGMERWCPAISVGFDGWMLSTVTAGMGPAGSLGAALLQACTMGIWRAVGLFYVQGFYSTVMKHSAEGS